MAFNKNQPVTVVDPDLSDRVLVQAWQQSIDKKTGQHLVVLEGEPDAIRRIEPANVFTGPRAVENRLK